MREKEYKYKFRKFMRKLQKDSSTKELTAKWNINEEAKKEKWLEEVLKNSFEDNSEKEKKITCNSCGYEVYECYSCDKPFEIDDYIFCIHTYCCCDEHGIYHIHKECYSKFIENIPMDFREAKIVNKGD